MCKFSFLIIKTLNIVLTLSLLAKGQEFGNQAVNIGDLLELPKLEIGSRIQWVFNNRYNNIFKITWVHDF